MYTYVIKNKKINNQFMSKLKRMGNVFIERFVNVYDGDTTYISHNGRRFFKENGEVYFGMSSEEFWNKYFKFNKVGKTLYNIGNDITFTFYDCGVVLCSFENKNDIQILINENFFTMENLENIDNSNRFSEEDILKNSKQIEQRYISYIVNTNINIENLSYMEHRGCVIINLIKHELKMVDSETNEEFVLKGCGPNGIGVKQARFIPNVEMGEGIYFGQMEYIRDDRDICKIQNILNHFYSKGCDKEIILVGSMMMAKTYPEYMVSVVMVSDKYNNSDKKCYIDRFIRYE